MAWRALWAALLVAAMIGFVRFQASAEAPAADLGRAADREMAMSEPPDAVVFTGAVERIDAGLDLLAAGRIGRLLISGVNANAGLSAAGFAAQFAPRHADRMAALLDCCVELGEAADNTLQNALETQCWLERRGRPGPLVLITSTGHMARAAAVLAAVLPGRTLLRWPVEPPAPDRQTDWRLTAGEYLKHLGTQALLRAPGARRLWPAAFGDFARGCS